MKYLIYFPVMVVSAAVICLCLLYPLLDEQFQLYAYSLPLMVIAIVVGMKAGLRMV